MYRCKTILNTVLTITSFWIFLYVVIIPSLFPRGDDSEYDSHIYTELLVTKTEMPIVKQFEEMPSNPSDLSNDDVVQMYFMPNTKKQCVCPLKSSGVKAEVPGVMKRTKKAYPDPTKTIRILSWTQLWGKHEGPWFTEGQEIFEECGFDPPLSCEYTHDRAQYDSSDAVLFHGFWIKDLPKNRHEDQKWIFWEYESPRIVAIMQNLTDFDNMFNITSTYTLDSDVPLPFLRKCVPAPGEINIKPKLGGNYAAGKTKQVAWFVSHCHTPSKRELYAKELQKHISVDIFGACGPYDCDRTDPDKCYNDLQKNYKFYLAFENSLCRDYVTEKLWNIFDHRLNIIPIVLGASDYSNMLPAGTYIDVQDFASPQQLAAYLKHLDKNDDEYNEFISRREFDRCRFTTPYRQYYCGLCEHLHRKRGKTEVALNIANMWSAASRCRTAGSFYNSIAKEVLSAVKDGTNS